MSENAIDDSTLKAMIDMEPHDGSRRDAMREYTRLTALASLVIEPDGRDGELVTLLKAVVDGTNFNDRGKLIGMGFNDVDRRLCKKALAHAREVARDRDANKYSTFKEGK